MSDPARIQLTETEIVQGALVGVMRQMQNMRRKRTDRYGAQERNAWSLHIEGALGEMAFARWAGRYWAGVGVFRGDDVGEDQVRTSSRDNGDLILHQSDLDDKRYWLPGNLRVMHAVTHKEKTKRENRQRAARRRANRC